MSQFPPEEMMGTSRDEVPTFGLPDRDPDCRKEDLQLGRVCTFFPGVAAGLLRLPRPVGEVLENAATAAPSREEALCEGRPGALGLPGSAWLSLVTSSEPHPTVHGGLPRGEAGASVVLEVKSWLCLRIRTVIRCWTREVPARKKEQEEPGCEYLQFRLSRPVRGSCSSNPGCPALIVAPNPATPQVRTQRELATCRPKRKDGHHPLQIQAGT